MSDAERLDNEIMAGGKSLIDDLLLKFVEKGIYEPVHVFINQIKGSNNTKCINKSMKPAHLSKYCCG